MKRPTTPFAVIADYAADGKPAAQSRIRKEPEHRLCRGWYAPSVDARSAKRGVRGHCGGAVIGNLQRRRRWSVELKYFDDGVIGSAVDNDLQDSLREPGDQLRQEHSVGSTVTTIPVLPENSSTSGNATSPATQLVFPHLVDAGGYTTQFILLSAAPGQSTFGSLRFYDTNGQPLNLTLR
jgi:hypothetical protein